MWKGGRKEGMEGEREEEKNKRRQGGRAGVQERGVDRASPQPSP